MTPPAERWKATNCLVLLSINWRTTVPSSLTPLTWLREYPEGPENVSTVPGACADGRWRWLAHRRRRRARESDRDSEDGSPFAGPDVFRRGHIRPPRT